MPTSSDTHQVANHVDCLIFVGTNFRALKPATCRIFSRLFTLNAPRYFLDFALNKNDTFVVFKIRGHSVFVHNSYRKYHFVGTGMCGSDPP